MQVQSCADLEAFEIPEVGSIEGQREWQEILAKKRPEVMDQSRPAETVGELTKRVRFNVEAIHQELAELLDHLPWKDWKGNQATEFEKRLDNPEQWAMYMEAAYEAIDIQHFLNSIFLAFGFTDEDVAKLYYAKQKENIARQRRGY